MGICSSCLSGGRRSRRPQDEDIDRILASGTRDRRSRRGGARNYGTLNSTDDDDDDTDDGPERRSSSAAAASDTLDEEELRRQRIALQSITAQAAENMIDVLPSRHSEQSFGARHKQVSVRSLREHHREHLRRGGGGRDNTDLDGIGEGAEQRRKTQSLLSRLGDEAAWLESVKAADADVIHMPSRRSRLVMDVNLKDGAKGCR